MTRITRHACTLLILAGLFPVQGWAQPAIEASFGYTVLDYSNKNLEPVGWFAAIAAKPLPRLTLVSEFSGEYVTDKIGTAEVRKRAFVFLDGPRYVQPFSDHAAVFVEALFGVAHDREFFSERQGTNHFVWQPGLGADVKLFDHVSARFQAAFRMQRRDRIANRFLSGLVIHSRPSPAQQLRAEAARKEKRERATQERLEREAEATKIANAEELRLEAETAAARLRAEQARLDAETAKSARDKAQADRDKAKADADKKEIDSATPPPKK